MKLHATVTVPCLFFLSVNLSKLSAFTKKEGCVNLRLLKLLLLHRVMHVTNQALISAELAEQVKLQILA